MSLGSLAGMGAGHLARRITARRAGRQLWLALRSHGTLGAGLHRGRMAAILGGRRPKLIAAVRGRTLRNLARRGRSLGMAAAHSAATRDFLQMA